jgi:ribosomal RNA-processing protein 8
MDPPKIHRRKESKAVSSSKKRKREGGKGVANAPPPKKQSRGTPIQNKLKSKLESGQFRWLNEQLYSTPSANAERLFSKAPDLYRVYHRGFATQVNKWPVNPVEKIAAMIQKEYPKAAVIGDFGCGDAHIARTVPQKVHSFDLCQTNEFVTVANSANVPLQDGELDVAVFCLSLMGTDFERFLLEARRTLRANGKLIIAEVKSRFSTDAPKSDPAEGSSEGSAASQAAKEQSMLRGMQSFKKILRALGFQLDKEDYSNKMFVLFELTKQSLSREKEDRLTRSFSKPKQVETILKSCKYKRR